MQQENQSTHEARIRIDQKPYESPNPTTGKALYALGQVPAHLELYREVGGDREDRPIAKGPETVHLKEDEHFHSGPAPVEEFTIIVNGEQKRVKKNVLTFTEVVALAFSNPPTGPNVVFTVTYKKAVGPMHQGTLNAGGTVEIKNGTIFNVTETDKS